MKGMIGWVVLIDGEVGRGVSVLVKEKSVYVAFDRCIRFERAELFFAHSHTKTSGVATP